jgi:RNA polymerase sigma-70 factor (ECF subfamily)
VNAQALPMTQAPDAADEHPEAAFIRRLVAGDQAAYGELYRNHSGDVFRLACRFVYSEAEAEEVVQEVFIAAFRYVGQFRGQSRLKTWLYRITVNRALKRRRWWRRRREVGADQLPQGALPLPGPDVRIADRQSLAIVQGLLDKLDARKRTVLVLHELEGLDTKEIAEVLDCPRSTVLTRLSRARRELIERARQAGVVREEVES